MSNCSGKYISQPSIILHEKELSCLNQYVACAHAYLIDWLVLPFLEKCAFLRQHDLSVYRRHCVDLCLALLSAFSTPNISSYNFSPIRSASWRSDCNDLGRVLILR